MVDGFDATLLQPIFSAVGMFIILLAGTIGTVWATTPESASRSLEIVVSILPRSLAFLPERQFRTAAVPLPFQARRIPPPSATAVDFRRRPLRVHF